MEKVFFTSGSATQDTNFYKLVLVEGAEDSALFGQSSWYWVALSASGKCLSLKRSLVSTQDNASVSDQLFCELKLLQEGPLRSYALHTFICLSHKAISLEWQNKRAICLNPTTTDATAAAAMALALDFEQTLHAIEEKSWPELPAKNASLAEHVAFVEKHGDPWKRYNAEHTTIAKALAEFKRPRKMLLHVCCGPDAAGVIEQLRSEYDLTCFWYDPNIQPQEEYDQRLQAFLEVCRLLDVPTLVGNYEVSRFMEAIRGLEHTPEQGAKCSACYDLRLQVAAQEARRVGCELFTTTLAISPHKVQQKLARFGAKHAAAEQVPYLAKDFQKENGFKDSVAFCKENHIFRQDYCGCWFSMHEGGAKARAAAQSLGLTPKTDLSESLHSSLSRSAQNEERI